MTRAAAVALVVVASCAGRDAPRAAPATLEAAPPARTIAMTRPGYPSVHARLRLTQRTVDPPPRVCELEIWLAGARFHVRDLAGRRLDEILADLRDPRQLGALPRTIEERMDRDAGERARAGGGAVEPTELYGDLASDAGLVVRPGLPAVELSAAALAPVAEQILAHNRMIGLQIVAATTRLGRAATEYHGFVMVSADGAQYRNEVTRVIAPPYLLFERTRAAGAELSYTREVTALDDGAVGDADLVPP